MTMKKFQLKPTVPENKKQRDASIYWNLSKAVRQNLQPKDRIENQINFVLSNGNFKNVELSQRLIELRSLNRRREECTV